MEDIVEASSSYSYEITERSCDAEDSEGVVVYGISMSRNGKKVATVDDISSMRLVVEKLLDLCGRNEVTPENLPEVIEDYLE